MYPVQIIIKETPSNWSKATTILDTIKAKNGTDSVDTVSGAVTAGDLAEVGGLRGSTTASPPSTATHSAA